VSVANPYLITGPALISFSGGRTSAYMLKQILDAHGGTLPDDVHVCFANTGLEDEQTLRFVHECATRWGVRVRWLEWVPRPRGKEGRATKHGDRFQEVGFNSAARNGEPFKALIERKKFLPNAVTRFCTSHLKVETMKSFMRDQGYERWTNAVGLRRDEMHRVFKQIARNEKGLERFVSVMPMSTARGATTKRDVWQFWLGDNTNPHAPTMPLPQGFDLGLWPYEGNCRRCFLKGYETLVYMERERPGDGAEMIAMEERASVLADKPSGARFVTEYSYRDIERAAVDQPLLIPIDPSAIEFDAECGLWCAGEAA
jgi:3'-phosphoadenosine 5'-phosphosulfate sulfotransferase (PAPS reductase)/FAD synthetase